MENEANGMSEEGQYCQDFHFMALQATNNRPIG